MEIEPVDIGCHCCLEEFGCVVSEYGVSSFLEPSLIGEMIKGTQRIKRKFYIQKGVLGLAPAT